MSAPILRSMVLCAEVHEDEDGDFDLRGVFRQLVIEAFPAVVRFNVFLMWSGLAHRAYRASIDVKGPGISEVAVDEIELPILTDGFYDAVGVMPVELVLDRPGDLYVETRLDNDMVASFFVPVLYRAAGLQTRTEEPRVHVDAR